MKHEWYSDKPKLNDYSNRSITCLQRLFLGIVVLSVLFFSCSEKNNSEDYPRSFNGIPWGTKISDLQQMNFVESKGQLKAYVIENDDLKIGTIDLKVAFYLFSEEHFCGVLVEYKGAENHEIMKNIYFEKYGKPDITNQEEMRWEWVWPGEVGVAVKYDKQKETGYLIYLYSPLLFKK